MSVKSNWAVVTGAGSGIGAALAHELATRGVGVVFVGRREDRLDNVRDGIVELFPTLVVSADIARDEDRVYLARRARKAMADQGGRLKYLVHNAGAGPRVRT